MSEGDNLTVSYIHFTIVSTFFAFTLHKQTGTSWNLDLIIQEEGKGAVFISKRKHAYTNVHTGIDN